MRGADDQAIRPLCTLKVGMYVCTYCRSNCGLIPISIHYMYLGMWYITYEVMKKLATFYSIILKIFVLELVKILCKLAVLWNALCIVLFVNHYALSTSVFQMNMYLLYDAFFLEKTDTYPV